jgi:hydrogenase/urease accessory protein HupE
LCRAGGRHRAGAPEFHQPFPRHRGRQFRTARAALPGAGGARGRAGGRGHDGRLDADELGAAAPSLARYVDEHYRLRADCGGDAQAGRLLHGELVGLALDEPGSGAPAAEQWVELTLDYATDAPITDLLFEVSVFMQTSTDHRDICDLSWNGVEVPEVVFSHGSQLRYYAPSSRPTPPLGDWVVMGVEHILGGWDHLAFVLALIVSARGLASLLGVVTAFTLAHSITLALAALDVVSVPPTLVEPLIAASIAWVGLENLLARGPRSRWPEAFVFGLVHGLGFASFLGEALAGVRHRLLPLAGFNIGVELGQLAVVIAVSLLLLVLRRAGRRGAPGNADERALAPRPVRRIVSAGVVIAGVWWLVQRAGWIG